MFKKLNEPGTIKLMSERKKMLKMQHKSLCTIYRRGVQLLVIKN